MTGGSLLGFSLAFIFVPLLSDIVNAVKEKEGITGENEKLNDIASGFFNISYAFGCLIAPILGGFFNDLYGFRYTCDIFAFSSLAYSIIFFFGSLVPYIINQRNKKNLEKKAVLILSQNNTKDVTNSSIKDDHTNQKAIKL